MNCEAEYVYYTDNTGSRVATVSQSIDGISQSEWKQSCTRAI